jgi:predicted nucleic acid-binding Zn ribbon protein
LKINVKSIYNVNILNTEDSRKKYKKVFIYFILILILILILI